MESTETWSSSQTIILWRELSWRLETCLQFVPDQAVDMLQLAVDSVETNRLSSELLFDIQTLQEGSWPKELSISPKELREDWIECMLALLVSYRIRPNLTSFKKVTDRLHTLEYLTNNQQCQMLYQSCLVALAEMDREKVTSLVESWPLEPEDPYWLVRRAGVYLELGDQLTATAAATDALEKIRRRRHADIRGFWGLSREGWCLRFLSQISKSKHFLARSDPNTHSSDVTLLNRNFDQELEESRCSPDTELHLVQERISGRVFPPRPVDRTRNSPDFDTGQIGETFHIGSYEPAARLGPAVNILRLCDLTGVPPSIGDVGFFRTAVSEALLWIREEYPGLWAAFVLRFREIGLDEYREPGSKRKQKPIRRSTLDVLPVEHLKRLHDATMRELYRSFEIADGRRSAGGEMSRHDAIQSIRRLGNAVTRFSMCLDDHVREEIFKLFLQISRTKKLSKDRLLQETMWNMAWRTIKYFSEDMINKWASEIFIQFPLVSEETQQLSGWPEITLFIRKSDENKVTRPDTEEFEKGIAHFVELVSSGGLIDRTGAAFRLLGMFDRGLLLEAECKAYRKALWSKLDANGLPQISEDLLFQNIHLQWPVENETKVMKGLESWILSGKICDRFTPRNEKVGDSESRYGVTYPDPENYLSEIRNIYFHQYKQPDLVNTIFSVSVRKEILVKILEWWQKERGRFFAITNKPRHFGGDVFLRVELTLQTMFCCVLESDVADEETRAGLENFLKDLKDMDRTGSSWFQVAAYLEVIPTEEYWSRIRSELWEGNENSAYRALVSWFLWIQKRKDLELGPVPKDIFITILSAVGNLRGERCLQACKLITQLVEYGYMHGEDFDTELLIEAVSSATTKIRSEEAADASSIESAEFAEMFPHLRREVTRLMMAIESQGIMLGYKGKDWLSRAKSDRFIDVRVVVD